MTRSFGLRTLTALALGATLPWLCGCDLKSLLPPPPQPAATPAPAPGPPPETSNYVIQAHRAGKRMELTSNLSQFAKLMFQRMLLGAGAPPTDWDSMIASDPTNKDFYEELRDAGVIVIWDAPDHEKAVGTSNAIVAFGPWVLEEGGPVATLDGRAENMTADELKQKLEAMGIDPASLKSEATDAAAAETATGDTPAETPAP